MGLLPNLNTTVMPDGMVGILNKLKESAFRARSFCFPPSQRKAKKLNLSALCVFAVTYKREAYNSHEATW